MNLSIIVPVYNVGEYIIRCLDSILNQKFTGDYEVIIVDDGSTDNSLMYIESYISIHQNIILIKHALNKGLAAARTSGIIESSGEYILHVDSDDWILPGMFKKLYDSAKKHNVDVLVFDYILSDGHKFFDRDDKLIKEEIVFENSKLSIQEYFMGSCWNKLVKRSIITDMTYGKVYMNTTEDLIYSLEVFLRSKVFLIMPEVFYVYYKGTKSLTKTVLATEYLCRQKVVYSELLKLRNSYNVVEAIISNVNYYLNIRVFGNLLKAHFSGEFQFEYVKEFLVIHKSFNDYKSHFEVLKATRSVFRCLSFNFKYLGILNTCKLVLKILLIRIIKNSNRNLLM